MKIQENEYNEEICIEWRIINIQATSWSTIGWRFSCVLLKNA